MIIKINQEEKEVLENCTISTLLLSMHIKDLKGIAIAVNDAVVPKSLWDTHLLDTNDQLLMITATAGG